MKALYITLCMLFLSAIGYSATYTTVADGNWNDLNTWDDGGGAPAASLPGASDDVQIEHNITFDIDATVNSLNLAVAGKTLTVTNTYTLTISGVLEDDGSGTLDIDAGGVVDVNSVNLNVSGATIINDGTLTITTVTSLINSTFTNNSTVTIGSTLTIDNGTFTNSGTLTTTGAVTVNNNPVITNTGTLDFGGLLDVNTSGGSWTNTGGVIQARGGVNVDNSNIANCINQGTLNYWGSLSETGVCKVSTSVTTLPVELVDFYGQQVGSEIELEWITASEKNNAYFKIESSTDSYSYTTIGEVTGSGTTSEKTHYNYVHKEPNDGLNYYRLLQVDFDGTSSYSDIISVYSLQEANLLGSAIVKRGTPVVVAGLSNDSQIILASTAGLSQTLSNTTETLEIQTIDLIPGAYFVAINYEDKYVQKINFVVVE